MAEIPPYPLYFNTYRLYRLSPLHHQPAAPLLADRALRHHAARLRDQLQGDHVRGIHIDVARAADTARLGPLSACAWDILGDEDAWIDRHRRSLDPDASQLSSASTTACARGIHVTLDYEKQSYNALLLREPGSNTTLQPFTALPLLLVRMPGSIRDIFLDYLRTAFDAYVAPLKLPSSFLISSLETYLKRISSPSSTQTIADVIGSLQVQLAFPNTTTLLKHLDISIAGPHVAGFVRCGRLMQKSHDQPFAAALSSYLAHHLALDMAHPNLHVTKISCSSFHFATDRIKLTAPDTLADTSMTEGGAASQDASAAQLAVSDFYSSLVRHAAGTGIFLSENFSNNHRGNTSSSTISTSAYGRKRAVSSAAVGNDFQKKVKAREQDTRFSTNGHGTTVDT